MENIKNKRDEIDKIDNEITALLSRRFEACEEIGKIKKAEGIDTTCPEREAEVLWRVSQGKYGEQIRKVYYGIFEESKKIQAKS